MRLWARIFYERLVVSTGAEDTTHLGDGLGILVGIVPEGTMSSLLRAFEVATPVGHDPVGADRSCMVFVSALAAVAHDRVVAKSGRERNSVDREDETVIRREGIDAVRDAVQLQGIPAGHHSLCRFAARAKQR